MPASRGAQSNVRVYADNALVDQFDGTGSQTRSVGVANNDGPHDVYLQVCNEKDSCSESSHKSVQTYGPITSGHILSIDPQVSGNQVNWVVTVDTNGDPATVNISSSRRNVTLSADSVNTVTVSSGYVDLGYAYTETVNVTLSDGAPNRGSARQTDSYRTPDPPPPTVSISQGTRCNDGTGSNPCNTGGGGENCINPSCARIRITTTNFRTSTATCVFHDNTEAGWSTRQITTNTSDEPGVYFGYPNRTVWAVCDGHESNHYDWPNN